MKMVKYFDIHTIVGVNDWEGNIVMHEIPPMYKSGDINIPEDVMIGSKAVHKIFTAKIQDASTKEVVEHRFAFSDPDIEKVINLLMEESERNALSRISLYDKTSKLQKQVSSLKSMSLFDRIFRYNKIVEGV